MSPSRLQTPTSYHRILSPTLSIPTAHTVPVPVGLLACQRDPLLCQLQTTVISCSPHQPEHTPVSNRKKNVDNAADGVLYEVILHDTVLFPEGGGQPSDIGILTNEKGNCWDVLQVKRRGDHAVHYIRVKDRSIDGFDVGAQVLASLGDEGFKRRLDHMSMHTSQHLLSALLETRLDLPTLSWALTAYPTPSYVELPRALTQEEIISVQNEANTLAFEGRAVYVEVQDLKREEEPGAVILENGRTVGKALPDDYTGGVKRTVIIDGVDRNPCCGTHLPSLNNLQLFILPQTESISRSSVSSSRLFFLCGARLIAHLASSHNLLTTTSNLLSCGPPLVPDRTAQVIDERKRAEKRVDELEAELAQRVAAELMDELRKLPPSRHFARHYHRTDDSSNPLGFLQSLSLGFSNLMQTLPPSDVREYVLLLSSSPVSQSSTSTSVLLIATSDKEYAKTVGEGLKVKLAAKGGGKGVRWSGKWVGVWKDAKQGKVVQEILDGI